MQITVADISVELIRKNIKRMHLYVLRPDGRIRITAPTKLSEEKIRVFILSKLEWIRKQQKLINAEPRPVPLTYSSGEKIKVFGANYTLETVIGKRKREFVFLGSHAILYDKKDSTLEQRERAVEQGLRKILKSKLDSLFPKWERITSLHPSSFQIKKMKSRWGTCNTLTKKIWLNLELVHKADECIEYVIMHELAHLRVANHGKDFYALMDYYMPSWRDLKKKLNETKPLSSGN